MRFVTTRGSSLDADADGTGCSFSQAVLLGVPTSGGLFVPQAVPLVISDQSSVDSWAALPTLAALAGRIFAEFADEGEKNEVDRVVRQAVERMDPPPLVLVNDKIGPRCQCLELFHGPSLAFKDIAVAPAVALLAHFLAKQKKQRGEDADSANKRLTSNRGEAPPDGQGLTDNNNNNRNKRQAVSSTNSSNNNREIPPTVIVATSGDTGPAILKACAGRTDMRAFCLFPQGRVSRRQALQMTSLNDRSLRVFQVSNANSDDLDVVVSKVFKNPEIRASCELCTLNSLNFARICGQIAIYFWAYFRSKARIFVVPTGAMGNIFAGLMAIKMGLDFKLVCANNENDVGARFFSQHEFVRRDVIPTYSPAMDISAPYNCERIIWLCVGCEETRRIMSIFERDGNVAVPKVPQVIAAGSASQAQNLSVMKRSFLQRGYAMVRGSNFFVLIFWARLTPFLGAQGSAHGNRCRRG